MAQSVEHVLGKDEVTGSNPVISSKQRLAFFVSLSYLGVAQFGSALEWGSRGRKFKSSHSDHKKRRWYSNHLLFLTVLSMRQNGELPSYGRMYRFYFRKQVCHKTECFQHQIFSLRPDLAKKKIAKIRYLLFYYVSATRNAELPSYGRMYCFFFRK